MTYGNLVRLFVLLSALLLKAFMPLNHLKDLPSSNFYGGNGDHLTCNVKRFMPLNLCLMYHLSLQVIGSVAGVRLITEIFPEIGLGPRLNVDIHRGALTEGLLTFAIVTISLGLSRKIPGSFFMKTWISSVSKLTLHILGSDLTGGCMNPASVSTSNDESL